MAPTPTRGDPAPQSRATEATRRALIDAAVKVFGEKGYEAASVRVITGLARVNQGAITYHFGGKEGLYRDVLRTVRDALSEQRLITIASLDDHDRETALRLFLRQTLAPLFENPRLKRYVKVFAWEQLKPTVVRRRLSAEEPFATTLLARAIVRRFRPEAEDEDVTIATAWLLGQTYTFVRDAEYLRLPPFNLKLGKPDIDRLVDRLADLCLHGMGASKA